MVELELHLDQVLLEVVEVVEQLPLEVMLLHVQVEQEVQEHLTQSQEQQHHTLVVEVVVEIVDHLVNQEELVELVVEELELVVVLILEELQEQ
jgi:hypothetical protein